MVFLGITFVLGSVLLIIFGASNIEYTRDKYKKYAKGTLHDANCYMLNMIFSVVAIAVGVIEAFTFLYIVFKTILFP